MHGGKSTGPRTEDGMLRLRAARTTHAFWGQESRAFRRYCTTLLAQARLLERLFGSPAARRRQDPMQSGKGAQRLGRRPHPLPGPPPLAGEGVVASTAPLSREAGEG
jgi:hypothetical protein